MIIIVPSRIKEKILIGELIILIIPNNIKETIVIKDLMIISSSINNFETYSRLF